MIKTPAKPKTPARASKAAKPSAKAVAKASKTRAPSPKAVAKKAPARKTAHAPKATGKEVSTKAPPPHMKPAVTRGKSAAPASRPASKAPKPAVKAPPAVKTVARAPAPPPPAKALTARPASAPRTSALARVAPPPAATPVASASRFADRFSPAKPTPRAAAYADIEVLRPTYKADPRLANAWKTKAGRDLTDDELLAMPDSEYMNEKQLEFFRVRLQKLKDDLLSNAGETTEHLREDTTIVPDPADRATIEEEHALELRTRDRERKLLKKITQSLARIESGEYGFCDETGEPIGLGRLLARPTATLSLEAQQRRELKQKMFGD